MKVAELHDALCKRYSDPLLNVIVHYLGIGFGIASQYVANQDIN